MVVLYAYEVRFIFHCDLYLIYKHKVLILGGCVLFPGKYGKPYTPAAQYLIILQYFNPAFEPLLVRTLS